MHVLTLFYPFDFSLPLTTAFSGAEDKTHQATCDILEIEVCQFQGRTFPGVPMCCLLGSMTEGIRDRIPVCEVIRCLAVQGEMTAVLGRLNLI